ncbi:MAG: R-phenyllactate dehydratase beta subunit [Syntrophorhabdaceae bacterium PtaU1.Bin034]|nr:MAG: R-phenyllactate dehydratase beta subunit [Syntrophorhabdaceae bacterium PtaU1.Bin034]
MTQLTNGLATAEKYYTQYGSRARELKAAGRKIIGYLTALGPVEILTAAGVVPLRLKGNVSEAITRGDAYMETIVCPFVRNVFDAAVKGKYDFLDGMVLPHQCDSIDRTSDIWNYDLNLPYFHFLNVPHVTGDPSFEFMKEILRIFISTLEKFTGTKITNEALTKAIKAHNDNRRLIRELYSLRKSNPPLISGTEMMKVLVATMGLPVDESSALVESVIREVKQRKATDNGKKARIMLIGDQVDDAAVTDMIEGAGARLVMDDISIGAKTYWADADVEADPVHAIAERYLRKLRLPTLAESDKTYDENVEIRFGHLKRYIDEFKVNGVIQIVYKYCDPYGFEVPTVKSFIESKGTPFLYLEDEYSTSTLPRMKTRIEAFLEMIGQ